MNPKCDRSAMDMIRNYLNDDEEEDIDTLESAYGYKKVKYSPETNAQYVQMDLNTLDFKPLHSNESKEALISQLPSTTQIFNGRDYFRCVNLTPFLSNSDFSF